MTKIILTAFAAIIGAAVIIKICWIGYLVVFKSNEIPDDMSGPASGWGTPDDQRK